MLLGKSLTSTPPDRAQTGTLWKKLASQSASHGKMLNNWNPFNLMSWFIILTNCLVVCLFVWFFVFLHHFHTQQGRGVRLFLQVSECYCSFKKKLTCLRAGKLTDRMSPALHRAQSWRSCAETWIHQNRIQAMNERFPKTFLSVANGTVWWCYSFVKIFIFDDFWVFCILTNLRGLRPLAVS